MFIKSRFYCFYLTFVLLLSLSQEMWSLFDFVCEGKLLGTSRTFKQEYENPIIRVGSCFH